MSQYRLQHNKRVNNIVRYGVIVSSILLLCFMFLFQQRNAMESISIMSEYCDSHINYNIIHNINNHNNNNHNNNSTNTNSNTNTNHMNTSNDNTNNNTNTNSDASTSTSANDNTDTSTSINKNSNNDSTNHDNDIIDNNYYNYNKQLLLEYVHIPKTGGSFIEYYGATQGHVIWGACHYKANTKYLGKSCLNDLKYKRKMQSSKTKLFNEKYFIIPNSQIMNHKQQQQQITMKNRMKKAKNDDDNNDDTIILELIKEYNTTLFGHRNYVNKKFAMWHAPPSWLNYKYSPYVNNKIIFTIVRNPYTKLILNFIVHSKVINQSLNIIHGNYNLPTTKTNNNNNNKHNH